MIDWAKLDTIADNYGVDAPRDTWLTWALAKKFAAILLPQRHTAAETDRLARILLARHGPERDRAMWESTQRRWLND